MYALHVISEERTPHFDYFYQGTQLTAMFSVGADESYPNGGRYEWIIGDRVVQTGLSNRYQLTADDVGKTVTARAHFADANGEFTILYESAASSIVHDVNEPGGVVPVNVEPTVVVDGLLVPGGTLHASVRDANGTTTSDIHYAWDVADADGNWTVLARETADELSIGATAPGVVRVFADYANDAGQVRTLLTAVGTPGADLIRSNDQIGIDREYVYAGAGDDIILGGWRGRYVDGGAGIDTYVAATGNTIITREDDASARWYVNDTLSRSFALLNDVERVRLQNGEGRALDIDGAAGQAYRLYVAAFDRTGDDAGLGFWISRLDAGTALADVADAFVASQEFRDVYGADPSHDAIVDLLYHHVLHRAPDAGARFWVDALDSGAASVADVLVGFSESAENVAQVVGAMRYGIAYTPYA